MIEVLKQALEALKEYVDVVVSVNDPNDWRTVADGGKPAREAITSLRQAIAEAEKQEPVAYLCENAVGHKYFRWKKPSSTYKPIALYTTPPQRPWVGLTDEDKKQMFKEANYHWEMTAGEYAERIGQLTEAKLKERNT